MVNVQLWQDYSIGSGMALVWGALGSLTSLRANLVGALQ